MDAMVNWSVLASGARMGASGKFKRGEQTRERGGVLSTCGAVLSITIVECEKTRQEVKRTTEWVFGWWTLCHVKYLRKTNLFIH